jgi:hypothetical protein
VLGAGVGGSGGRFDKGPLLPPIGITIKAHKTLTVTSGVIKTDGGNGGNQSGTAGNGGASTMGPGGKGGDMGPAGIGGLAGDISIPPATKVPPINISQIPGKKGTRSQSSQPGQGGSGHPDGNPGKFIPG